MAVPVTQQLASLNSARQIVLGDAQLYPRIVEGILPIIGANARVELRRWGAEFLAETFASPVVPSQLKENMGLRVLQTLKDLLDFLGQDIEVLKGVVQAAASIYGFIFRYIIANPNDSSVWGLMTSIKSNILKRWDTGAAAVRICCIKFVQKVVQVQTPGVVDPRRPDKNEISLALVPREHPLIPSSRLEPEASGLLDRLLNVFHEEHSDTIYLTATLNCLGALLRTRPSTFNKIISAVLNFNPFRQVNGSMSIKSRLQVKSLEKTIRILLLTVVKRNDDGPIAGRIKVYVERLERSRLEMFAAETASKKRGLPNEPTDGLDGFKRRRLEAETSKQSEPSPLPPGPNSYAQLFTLTDDAALASFGVWQIPQDLVTRATLAILVHIEGQSLDNAINHVRSRYLALSKAANAARIAAQQASNEDDEEDYEPDFEPSEDREQILNAADALPLEESPTEMALGPFTFPQPPALTPEDSELLGRGTIDRVFGMISTMDDGSVIKRKKPGMSRLASSSYDKEAWITILIRIATRCCSHLIDNDENGTSSGDALVKQQIGPVRLGNAIRESLYAYILEDFRARIGVAIAWLNEEWFNDRISAKFSERKVEPSASSELPDTPNYDRWAVKLLDGIMPYLDAKDKLLLRFLSEIPVVNKSLLARVKALAKDPERIDLAVKAIHYLILMKPPARDICIDAVEELWRNNEDAKGPTTKLLMKWRPHVLPPAINKNTEAQQTTNGAQYPISPKVSPAPAVKKEEEAADGDQMKNPQAGMPVAAAG